MMIKRALFLTVLTAALASPAALAWGGKHEHSNCEQSASSMLRACHFDVRDDLNTTIASCQHIADQGDRWSCYIGAYNAKADDSAECRDIYKARVEACDLLEEDRYDPDPLLVGDFVDLENEGPLVANPYISVEPGHTYVLRAGEDEEELVIVHVTDNTQEVQGVACRVVVDIVFEVSEEDGEVEYEVVEATDDLFAINTFGDVVYCGEVSRNYEDGILRDLDGSFESGIDYAKAGYLIKAIPTPPFAHRQEFLPGEAEDIVQYMSLTGDPEDEGVDGAENFPCNSGCLQTRDTSPLGPGDSEYKYYLPEVGFVLALALEDDELTGEREELLCVGDDLSVLGDANCGIGENLETVLEELCRISPDAFCAEEEEP
jgi:hypothetical protein